MRPSIRVVVAVAAVLSLTLPSNAGAVQDLAQPERSALSELEAVAGPLHTSVAPETGAVSMVRAASGDVLVADDAARDPLDRATAFLRVYGGAVGMSVSERAALGTPASPLRLRTVHTDVAGNQHVRLDQVHGGLEVYAAQLVVHLSDDGVTGVNGRFVPRLDVAGIAAVPAVVAGALAGGEATGLLIHRVGLVEDHEGPARLAWAVETDHERFHVDALTGEILFEVDLHPHAKDRVVYTPRYEPDHPELFQARWEDGPPNPVPPVDNLFRFTGQTYDLFQTAFGFDSYDHGEIARRAGDPDPSGATMRTVYLVNEVCPNAYWNGQATHYCPGFDLDDVVGHEWGHAYTDYTHDLVYKCQPGALNESYSDIWGEVIDLLNDEDSVGGANNDAPYPVGQRWLVGEDLTERVHRVLLRDMWDPERLGDPERVRSSVYHCGADDNEGVHYNSGVPNHAFAMLTDGKVYRGLPVRGLGLTKTAHLYWQAQAAYQGPASKFRDHDQALRASCLDLQGVDLADLETGEPTGEIMTPADCDEVAKAMLLVEMSAPVRCAYTPILGKEPPAACEGATTLFAEDFEDGLAGWDASVEGAYPTATPLAWESAASLPGGRAGGGAFAPDPRGHCERPGQDRSGRASLDSPTFTIAEGRTELRFDHYVETQAGRDGGNVLVSIDGGDWTLVPLDAYAYNAPAEPLTDVVSLGGANTNPKAGEHGWSGVDGGEVNGSWGTTVIDLSKLAAAGQSVRVRFDFGTDCGGGWTGWYVDDVEVLACPPEES